MATKRTIEDNKSNNAKRKSSRISSVLYHSYDGNTYSLDTNDINTLGELIQRYPEHFPSLKPENLVNSTSPKSKSSYFKFTTTLCDWKSKLSNKTPISRIKELIPVFYITLHHFYLKVNRSIEVAVLKTKLNNFFKGMVYWVKDEIRQRDAQNYESFTDYTFARLSDFPFKVKTPEGKIVEIFNDGLRLNETGIVDESIVLFENDRESASSLNFHIYFNEYQKIVCPRIITWHDFETLANLYIKDLMGCDDYVIVKRSLECSWDPIIKTLNKNKPVFPQIQSRDMLFGVQTIPLPEHLSGNHIIYIKSDTSDCVLKQLNVDPEITLGSLLEHIGIQREITHCTPEEILWDNTNSNSKINFETYQVKQFNDFTKSPILRFSFSEPTDLRCFVFTPDAKFIQIEVQPQITCVELSKHYVDYLKTRYNFDIPQDVELIIRTTDRRQDLWETPSNKNLSLQHLVRKQRNKFLYFSFKIPIVIQESKSSMLTIYGNMHNSIGRTVAQGSCGRFSVLDLCLMKQVNVLQSLEGMGTSRFEPIVKHQCTVNFLEKILIPFSTLTVNDQKLICPHYQSINKTLMQNGIWVPNSTLITRDGTKRKLTNVDFPEDIVFPPIEELNEEYNKAKLCSSEQKVPFTIEQITSRDFDISLTDEQVPFVRDFRVHVSSLWPNKPHKVYIRNTTNNSHIATTPNFLQKEKWNPNYKDFVLFVDKLHRSELKRFQNHLVFEANEKLASDFKEKCNTLKLEIKAGSTTMSQAKEMIVDLKNDYKKLCSFRKMCVEKKFGKLLKLCKDLYHF